MSGKEFVNYDFPETYPDQNEYYSDDDVPDYYDYNYDYSNGITGSNVLVEQMRPTRPSFITGQNVIRWWMGEQSKQRKLVQPLLLIFAVKSQTNLNP